MHATHHNTLIYHFIQCTHRCRLNSDWNGTCTIWGCPFLECRMGRYDWSKETISHFKPIGKLLWPTRSLYIFSFSWQSGKRLKIWQWYGIKSTFQAVTTRPMNKSAKKETATPHVSLFEHTLQKVMTKTANSYCDHNFLIFQFKCVHLLRGWWSFSWIPVHCLWSPLPLVSSKGNNNSTILQCVGLFAQWKGSWKLTKNESLFSPKKVGLASETSPKQLLSSLPNILQVQVPHHPWRLFIKAMSLQNIDSGKNTILH